MDSVVYTAECPTTEDKTLYNNATYFVVTNIAYLIGVKSVLFECETSPFLLNTFEQLNKNKSARIIRNLCILRTAIEQNFSNINQAMYYDLKNLHTLPDLVPVECIYDLERDGVRLIKANYKLENYIIDINCEINNRINNIQSLIPMWIKWGYIRELFIMPNGLKIEGIRAAATEYYSRKSDYPYSIYINWPLQNRGNILYNDEKFVTLLYEAHEDYFSDKSKVNDASDYIKNGIYKFLEESNSVVILVDCENSDPFKACGMLTNLHREELNKIQKIILFNDIHTSTAWRILNDYTDISIEHRMIERIKSDKSLVDMHLAVNCCKEFYENKIDSFVLLSSDSDYWSLISELAEAKFLVMVESVKCGPNIKEAMQMRGIFYCYLDDFCTGNSNEIKTQALLSAIQETLNREIDLNINELIIMAETETRVGFSDAERKRFFDRFIRHMRLEIQSDGQITVMLGE